MNDKPSDDAPLGPHGGSSRAEFPSWEDLKAWMDDPSFDPRLDWEGRPSTGGQALRVPLLNDADFEAWEAALAVGLRMDPPRQWAPIDRRSGLWPIAREVALEALAPGSRRELSTREEALALSYLNSRSADEFREDTLRRVVSNFATDPSLREAFTNSMYSTESSPKPGSIHYGAVNGLAVVLGWLARVLGPINHVRTRLNQAIPFDIMWRGMGAGDFVVFMVIGTALLLIYSGLTSTGP